MQAIDTHAIARGYAEILGAEGGNTLLRLHAVTAPGAVAEEQLYYAVAADGEVIFVSDEPGRAAARFASLPSGRGSEAPAREDFLASTPTRLPTIRGAAFHRLAAQVSELSRSGGVEH